MVLHMILIQPLVIVTPPKMTSIAFFLTEDDIDKVLLNTFVMLLIIMLVLPVE
jgi:hypothetical protein